MAIDKAVDSSQLDADLTSVANAIRTKGGTSASLTFPAGFVSAIGDIPTGGGGVSKKYIIKDGVIQSGNTAQTVSPALITEESGGYVHLSVTGNNYCTAYFNGVDFSGYDFLVIEFFIANNACGWSWVSGSSYSNGIPAVSAGNGNASHNQSTSQIYCYIPGLGDLRCYSLMLPIDSLTTGNVKMAVSAQSSHLSAYLDIKNMYLMGE